MHGIAAILTWATVMLGMHAVAGKQCTTLKRNILTSKNCPAACSTFNTCVLYADYDATSTGSCQNPVKTTKSGDCNNGSITLDTETCDVTYQCPNLYARANNDTSYWFYYVSNPAINVGSTFSGSLIQELGPLDFTAKNVQFL